MLLSSCKRNENGINFMNEKIREERSTSFSTNAADYLETKLFILHDDFTTCSFWPLNVHSDKISLFLACTQIRKDPGKSAGNVKATYRSAFTSERTPILTALLYLLKCFCFIPIYI